MLLSKLDETLQIDFSPAAADNGKAPETLLFPLATNLYPGATSPQGYRALESYTAYPAPTWTWAPASGVRIRKTVWMGRGRNTT